MNFLPEDADLSEVLTPSAAARRSDVLLAIFVGLGLGTAGLFALGVIYGTRSGQIDALTQLPSETVAARLPALPVALHALPFTGAISWRYMPLRHQWFLSGPVDQAQLERYFRDQDGSIAVRRSESGIAFSVTKSDVRATGRFDFADRKLTLVSSAPPSPSKWTAAHGLAVAPPTRPSRGITD